MFGLGWKAAIDHLGSIDVCLEKESYILETNPETHLPPLLWVLPSAYGRKTVQPYYAKNFQSF